MQVSYLLVGAEALGHRLPGKLGTWTLAIWRRLNPALDPAPTCVPLADVLDVASAVTVTPERATALQTGFGLELWLQHYVVDRIPGGFTQPDTDAADPVDDTRPDLASATGRGRSSSTGSAISSAPTSTTRQAQTAGRSWTCG